MKLVCYIFLLSILFSLFARLNVCLSYLINQTYYAEVLCENKEEEDSCCKGKCAMEKELVMLEEKEEQVPTKNSESNLKTSKVEEAVITTLNFAVFNKFISLVNTTFNNRLEEGITAFLFKPPKV